MDILVADLPPLRQSADGGPGVVGSIDDRRVGVPHEGSQLGVPRTIRGWVKSRFDDLQNRESLPITWLPGGVLLLLSSFPASPDLARSRKRGFSGVNPRISNASRSRRVHHQSKLAAFGTGVVLHKSHVTAHSPFSPGAACLITAFLPAHSSISVLKPGKIEARLSTVAHPIEPFMPQPGSETPGCMIASLKARVWLHFSGPEGFPESHVSPTESID